MALKENLEYFLDPEGKNLTAFIDSTLKALECMRVWWDGSQSIVSQIEIEQKREKLSELLKILDPKYRGLQDLLNKIIANVKFNQKNFTNVHPSPFLPSIIASLLVSIQNPNNITEEVSPATSKLEIECIEFYKSLIGYPKDAWGTLVCDGTIGNLTAMLVARDEKYRKRVDSEERLLGKEGLFTKTPGVILTTANSHYSIDKGMWILGMGTQNLIKIPVAVDELRFQQEHLIKEDRFEVFDNKYESYKFRVNELKDFYAGQQEPFNLLPNMDEFGDYIEKLRNQKFDIIGILLTAGSTQTGTIENISELIPLKIENNIYLHIDAAIGGYALCIPEIKRQFEGLKNADSITIDGHKLGFLHYPCGAVLFRDREYKSLIEHTAPYLQRLSLTIEGSRPGTPAAACWLAQKMLKEQGYRELIGQLLGRTKYLARRLVEENYQIYHKVHLNTIVFGINNSESPREKINDWNFKMAQKINERGNFFINTTQTLSDIKVRNVPSQQTSKLVDIRGIRVLIMNPFTEEETIEEFITELEYNKKRIIS